jgi:solute carrier family 25 (mitochondrial uncoupling protein), member 27
VTLVSRCVPSLCLRVMELIVVLFRQDGPILHAMSSAVAGLVAATLGAPADVVKTRYMNQPTSPDGRGLLYSSSLDCLKQTVRAEGFQALYKGWLPTWLRMAPWSLVFFLSFEQLRRLTGQSSF